MGAQLRILRRRIRSMKSMEKITRAQELIASSRIVKAQQRMQAAVAVRARDHSRRHGGASARHSATSTTR